MLSVIDRNRASMTTASEDESNRQKTFFPFRLQQRAVKYITIVNLFITKVYSCTCGVQSPFFMHIKYAHEKCRKTKCKRTENRIYSLLGCLDISIFMMCTQCVAKMTLWFWMSTRENHIKIKRLKSCSLVIQRIKFVLLEILVNQQI